MDDFSILILFNTILILNRQTEKIEILSLETISILIHIRNLLLFK